MAFEISSIRVAFGGDDVLRDVSATLRPRDRVALVGRNGAGKTTLLRVIARELEPDGGAVSLPAATRVALHDQRPPLVSDLTLGRYVGEGAARAEALERELRALESRMAAGDEGALRAYDRAQREFDLAGGYAWRSRLESVARGLGFTPEDLDRPLRSFSGGELTRASLARALAGEPDLLLLDEPTNHLDVGAIEWLEEHLDGLDACVLFVSHDRWFLESVAGAVLEIERGRGRLTRGSYSHWRHERALAMAQQSDLAERQAHELAHLQRFVDRFRYGTKSRQAQSKLKAMARIERERVERPRELASLRFTFPAPARSGRIVADANALDVAVPGRTLVRDASFAIERGHRVALLGPNGAGKTTLVETLLGRRPPAAGTARLGHGARVGYYSQQSLDLPEAARLVDAVGDGALTRGEARTLLGRFLFSGDQVEKPVSVLSGGERRRLALARLVVSGANFLVLDEPTNHLDIESRETLEDALTSFVGTMLLVSHDRALIEAVANRTLAIEDGRVVAREGGFGDYARAVEAAAGTPAAPPAPPQTPERKRAPARVERRERPRRPSQRAAREAARIEERIAALEEELGGIEARLAEPDAYGDPATVADDGRRHQALQEELAWLMREWERHAADAG
jgi:ATP-binding cassette subfamily F protein 3